MFERLFTWQSPERAWEPKERQWYVLYSLFFVLIILITIILSEYLLTLAIIAFVFLWFTHASIPPDTVEHTVTSLGIKTFDKLYKWNQIKHYWFSIKENVHYLHLDIIENLDKPDFMRRLSLIISTEDEEDLFFLLLERVDYGDKDEISFNILTKILHGNHIDISKYLPDEMYSQEEYLEGIEDEKKKK